MCNTYSTQTCQSTAQQFLFIYIKTVYLGYLGRHVSTITGSSSGPQRTQIQNYTVSKIIQFLAV